MSGRPRKNAATHGTERYYRTRGCSCEICLAAMAKRRRELRRRNAAKYMRSENVCRICSEPVWQSKPGQKFRHARRVGHEADPIPAPWASRGDA